ncbi:MAG TPA: methyltransferase domain-containing protein [Phycisphaerales bacterium]|nr:methyltransferase domain-containing protein [Phycisphaerales bacterium]
MQSRLQPRSSQFRRFAREFLARPGVVGAVAPSSQGLAKRMLEDLHLDRVQSVVEFGPGTGAVTREIITRLGPETRFFAIERSPDMAQAMRERFPQVTLYEDSAGNVESLCRKEGIEPGTVDCIVSGLPFAAFPPALQVEIIDAAVRVLKPGGRFVTFAYYVAHLKDAGRRFRKLLDEKFGHVSKSRGVLLNVPPAFVYRCRKSG